MTLAFTLLISVLAASYIVPTRALPPTLFTLTAVLSPDRFWGYYGGYWDMWLEIVPEFAKIGIDLQLDYQTDIYDVWYLVWGPDVPEGGRPPGSPPQGWDLVPGEWWTQPQGMLWDDGIVLAKNLINGPLEGFNQFPYLSQASDEFFWGMQTSFDLPTRKAYAHAWQEELMHNPPIINVYYPHVYSIRGSYFEGYNDYVWENQVSNIVLNQSTVEALHNLPPGPEKLTDTAYDRLTNQTVIMAASEAWWSYLPPYIDSYTEERFMTLIFQTLYRLSIDPWPTEGEIAPPEDYNVIPWLARSDPIFNETFTDWDGEQASRYRIPLREGVQWSDGEVFDSQDAVWNINNVTLDFSLGTTATGDFAPIVKRAEYIGNFTPSDIGYNATAFDLIVYEPYVDLTLILANDWGLPLLPYHYFGGVAPLRGSNDNTLFSHAKLVPALGPFKYFDEGSPPGSSDITLERNDKFFGYNTSIVGSPAWGPVNVSKWVFEHVPDAALRLTKLKLHEVDYAEYPTASVTAFEALLGRADLNIKVDIYPAANPLWINFNSPYSTNRYVRLAYAHAIPYPDIFKDVLPSWGIKDPIPGGSFIHPWQYYQGESLYHSGMDRYTYDLDIARQYLSMWNYSQTGTDYTKGPVGDANFDGIVDLDDLFYWTEEFGNTPYTRTLENPPESLWLDPSWYTTYPWPKDNAPESIDGSVAPGNEIDADFDNSGTVGAADYALWLAAVGNEYPFPGAF